MSHKDLNEHELEDRKFLHDLATPVTVIKSILRMMQAEIEGTREPVSPEKHLERLRKAAQHIANIEDLSAERKDLIFARESAARKKAA